MTSSDTPSDASWEAWPRFIKQDCAYPQVLHTVIEQYGEENLTTAFRKTCRTLMERDSITTACIPSFSFEDLHHVDTESIKSSGCFVVRNVIDPAQIDNLFGELQLYLNENNDIKGWPADNPCIKLLYWSKLQIILREHPNQLKLQKWVNELWSDKFSDPLTYADAVRVRPPKAKMMGLGPHIDAGSLSRWGHDMYRQYYNAVFSGYPEHLDMYDIVARNSADERFYEGQAHCSVFRTFQGWTALSPVGNRRGGLFLRPYPKETIPYVLLRPFFRPTKDPLDPEYLDPDTWEFDAESAFFPGTYPHESQNLSADSHPHLNLKNTLVSIPDLQPGDTVWWHCDMIHAVDVDHDGDEHVGVVYIGATPSTEKNLNYIKNQTETFKSGRPPPDHARYFAPDHTETKLKGYPGNVDILSEAGMRALLI